MKLLGELLIEKGYLTEQQLNDAIKIQKEKKGLIGNHLIQLGYVTEEQVIETLCEQVKEKDKI